MKELILGFTRFAARPWFVPAVAVLAALDSFVVVIPIDPLLVAGVLADRRRWFVVALIISMGSAFGALLLALVVHYNADWILGTLFKDAQNHKDWLRATALVQEHGAKGIALISLSPIPQHPAIIMGALAKMSFVTIYFASFVGRIVKYSLWAFLASHAPGVLMKVPSIRKALGGLPPAS